MPLIYGRRMARYKEYDYSQGKFIPISFDKQILPGTFEYTLRYLINNEIDLSVRGEPGNQDRHPLRGGDVPTGSGCKRSVKYCRCNNIYQRLDSVPAITR